MLNAQPEPPASGNWAWLVAFITGAFGVITAFVHRIRSKPRPIPPRIPSQNAQEVFERLDALEARARTSEGSLNRAWSAIEDIRADVRDIKRDASDIKSGALTQQDLDEALKRQLHKMREMLDNKA